MFKNHSHWIRDMWVGEWCSVIVLSVVETVDARSPLACRTMQPSTLTLRTPFSCSTKGHSTFFAGNPPAQHQLLAMTFLRSCGSHTVSDKSSQKRRALEERNVRLSSQYTYCITTHPFFIPAKASTLTGPLKRRLGASVIVTG